MKLTTVSLIALIATSGSAFADSLTTAGLSDPEVMRPASPSGDWTGAYVGLSYGKNKTTRTRVEEGYDYHEATCTRGTGKDAHQNNKCKLNDALYDALTGVPVVLNPWDTAPYDLSDGVATDQLAKYDAGYKGLWLGDDIDGVHTWRLGEDVPDQATIDSLNSDPSRDAVLSIAHVFKEDQTITEDASEFSVGAFVGYRHDFGRIVAGAEIGKLGELASAELQVGVDLGRVLVYGLAGAGQYDGDSGTLYGLGTDVKLGNRFLVGVKYTTGDFDGRDVDTASARFAIKF